MVSLISVASGTRGIGLLGYTASTAACAWAWRRTAQKRAWLTLAFLQLFLLLDLIFNWRWKLHDRVVGLAMADSVYDERRWPQKIVLALVLVLMIRAGVASSASFSTARRLDDRCCGHDSFGGVAVDRADLVAQERYHPALADCPGRWLSRFSGLDWESLRLPASGSLCAIRRLAGR